MLHTITFTCTHVCREEIEDIVDGYHSEPLSASRRQQAAMVCALGSCADLEPYPEYKSFCDAGVVFSRASIEARVVPVKYPR